MTLKISNSEMKTFKKCRRHWYLSYYRELGTPKDNEKPIGALQLGTKVHDALQFFYEENGNPLDKITELYMEERERWEDEPAIVDEIVKEQVLATAMLEGYVAWLEETGADSGYKIVEVEQAVEVPIKVNGEDVILRGKLDARVERKTDGARLFLDHKTVANLTEPARTLHMDEQMKFYHLLEELDAKMKTGNAPPNRTDGGLYNMLRKVKRTANAKPPFYERIEVQHNIHEIRNMWTRVYGVISDMLNVRKLLDEGESHHKVAYPNPTRECTFMCPFLAVCPMMDDGSDYEGFLESQYEYRDPHERYNKK